MVRVAFAALCVTAALSGSGCGPANKVVIPREQDPAQIFLYELETRLLRAQTAHVVAELRSEGAVNSELSAELFLGEGQRARLDVKGTFEARSVRAQLVCDGTTMHVRGAARTEAPQPCPPEVRDALVIGFVRMGLLHNAALLVGGSAPDHAAGNVHNWVRAERVKTGEPATHILFDVVVKTDVMGDAVLMLSPDVLPMERKQRVDLEEGELNVVEKYSVFELDKPVDAAVFTP